MVRPTVEEAVPGGHGVHMELAVWFANEPAGHWVQDVRPAELEKYPTAQGEQAVEEGAELNVPELHA